MLHWSDQEQFLYQLQIDIQKEILKTFAAPLLCLDSSSSDENTDDEEDRNCEVMSKAFVYASLEDSRYIFWPATLTSKC